MKKLNLEKLHFGSLTLLAAELETRYLIEKNPEDKELWDKVESEIKRRIEKGEV